MNFPNPTKKTLFFFRFHILCPGAEVCLGPNCAFCQGKKHTLAPGTLWPRDKYMNLAGFLIFVPGPKCAGAKVCLLLREKHTLAPGTLWPRHTSAPRQIYEFGWFFYICPGAKVCPGPKCAFPLAKGTLWPQAHFGPETKMWFFLVFILFSPWMPRISPKWLEIGQIWCRQWILHKTLNKKERKAA